MDKGGALILETFIPYRLAILSNKVSSAIANFYAERFKIGIPEWRVLTVLSRFEGLSAAEVGEKTEIDKVAVSRAVSKLLKLGYIKRKFAKEDRRRSVLALSANGKRVYQEVIPEALSYEKKLMNGLSATERKTLDELLDKLMMQAISLKEKDD